MRTFPSDQTGHNTNRPTHSNVSRAVLLYPYLRTNVTEVESILPSQPYVTQGWIQQNMLPSQAVTAMVTKSALEAGVEHALARLDEFEHLEEDWDSYGAPPIDKAMLEEARKVLKASRDNPELNGLAGLEFYPYPSPTGGVALEYEFQGRELRLKLYPDSNDRVAFRVLKSMPEKYDYEQFPYRLAELRSHFRWLSGGR